MKQSTHTNLAVPLIIAFGVVSLFVGAGCTSPSTTATAKVPPITNPRPVVVHDFAFDLADLHTDSSAMSGREGPAKRILGSVQPTETPAQKAARFAELLSSTIASELTNLKIPASRQPRGTPLPADGLVVGGQFVQVDEGNRLKRAIVGFGAGETEVLAQVVIYDLAQSRDQPILVYGTGTGSKPMPGAVVTMNPYAMAARYVLSRNATEKDVRKLGKQIATDLAQVEAGGRPGKSQ